MRSANSNGAQPLLRVFGGGSPLSEKELRAFEAQYALALPLPYRAFLAATNGGRPERDLFELRSERGPRTVRVRFFFGLEIVVASCNLGWYRSVLANRLPAEFLAIGTTEEADKLCISLSRGTVSHWDGRTGRLDGIAASFTDFERSLIREASLPTPHSSVWSTRRPR